MRPSLKDLEQNQRQSRQEKRIRAPITNMTSKLDLHDIYPLLYGAASLAITAIMLAKRDKIINTAKRHLLLSITKIVTKFSITKFVIFCHF